MGRYFNKAKAKAWQAKRNVGEQAVITPVSDNAAYDNLRRPAGARPKRDYWTTVNAKIGKDFCEHCRWTPPVASILHAHHIIPISCGGPDARENILVLCPNCHAIAHYVTARSNLTRTYTGPRTADQLRELMWAIKTPRRLKAMQQAQMLEHARPILDSLRASLSTR